MPTRTATPAPVPPAAVEDVRAILDAVAAGEHVEPGMAQAALTDLIELVPGLDNAMATIYGDPDAEDVPDAHRRALLTILDSWGQPDPGMLAQLPRYTGNERDKSKRNKSRCDVCGGWHEQPSIHLDYMGHADVTEALIKIDPFWTWRPAAINQSSGGPAIVPSLGKAGMMVMWAYLTILGKEMLCVGTAQQSKEELEKELIGDMIRNGALRFGIAVRLWSKADHEDVKDTPEPIAAGGSMPATPNVAVAPVAAGATAGAIKAACGGQREVAQEWWGLADRGEGPYPVETVNAWVAEAKAWYEARTAPFDADTAAPEAPAAPVAPAAEVGYDEEPY